MQIIYFSTLLKAQWRCPTFPTYTSRDDDMVPARIASLSARFQALHALLGEDGGGEDSSSSRSSSSTSKSAANLIAASLPSRASKYADARGGSKGGANSPPEDYVTHELLRMSTYLTILQYPEGEFQTRKSTALSLALGALPKFLFPSYTLSSFPLPPSRARALSLLPTFSYSFFGEMSLFFSCCKKEWRSPH